MGHPRDLLLTLLVGSALALPSRSEPAHCAHLPAGALWEGGLRPAALPPASPAAPERWRDSRLLERHHDALELLRRAGVEPGRDVDSLVFGVYGAPRRSGITALGEPLAVVAAGRLDAAAIEAAAPPGLTCRQVAPATVLIGETELLARPASGRSGPDVEAVAAAWLAGPAAVLAGEAGAAGMVVVSELGEVVAQVEVLPGALTVSLRARAASDEAARERVEWTNGLLDLLRPLSLGRPGLEGAASVELSASGDELFARMILNDLQAQELAELVTPLRAAPPLAGPAPGALEPERRHREPAAAGQSRRSGRGAGRR